MKARPEQHQTTVRFTEQDLALLDAIQAKTGIVSRTEILRRAIRVLAEHEKVATTRRQVARTRGR
jgi:metal-responsive CopG/Arc/MetJ family transcriptional regulator